jgi:hypothetical protein
MGETRNGYRFYSGNLTDAEGRTVTLKEISCGLDSNGSEWGSMAESCKRENEFSGSIKDWKFY